jgi:hypothetical protein
MLEPSIGLVPDVLQVRRYSGAVLLSFLDPAVVPTYLQVNEAVFYFPTLTGAVRFMLDTIQAQTQHLFQESNDWTHLQSKIASFGMCYRPF